MSMDQLMALVPIEAANTVVEKGRKSRWEKTKERKGETRWGGADDKPYLPPTYVDLPTGLTPAQMDQFLREQRFDELSKKLAIGELEFGDPDIRPPSPSPIYDKNGSRINTRDVRVRNAMTAEYQRLVEYMVKNVEGFTPPSDYKPLKKVRRIEIPLEKYPEYNFMGLIIGPRGCNHKRLESESGAQISIRGKGTQKEGKRTDHQTDEEATMPMHVHVTADSEEIVEKAVALIEPLLDPCHPMHEEFKKRGLEQLALVNGVSFNQLEQQRCSVCGAVGHLAYECPDSQQLQNFKKPEVRCAICGDMGHVTMDCKFAKQQGLSGDNVPPAGGAFGVPNVPPPPPGPPQGAKTMQQKYFEKMKMDMEYKKMMTELTGETAQGNQESNTVGGVANSSLSPNAQLNSGGGAALTPPPGMSPLPPSPAGSLGFGRGSLPTQNGASPIPPPPPDDRRNDTAFDEGDFWQNDFRGGRGGAMRGRGVMGTARAGIGHPDRGGRGGFARGGRGAMARGGMMRARMPFPYSDPGMMPGSMYPQMAAFPPWNMGFHPGMMPPMAGPVFGAPPQMMPMGLDVSFVPVAGTAPASFDAPPLPTEAPPLPPGETSSDMYHAHAASQAAQAAQAAAWQMSMMGNFYDPNGMLAMQMMSFNPMGMPPPGDPIPSREISNMSTIPELKTMMSPSGEAMDMSN